MKNKKNVLGVINGSLETYTRYSRVANEEQKKRILGVLSNLAEGRHGFFIFFEGAICKKVWKPGLECIHNK